MGRDARGIDLVVGAKGSPMQLILSGIYHADAPDRKHPACRGRRLSQKNRLVKKAIPLALGDSWQGLSHRRRRQGIPRALRRASSPPGRAVGERRWRRCSAHEVAARTGARRRRARSPARTASAARATSTPSAVHGGRRAGAQPARCSTGWCSPASRASGRCTRSTRAAGRAGPQGDAEDREVTVLLIQYASPLAAAMLPRQINANSELQAASPAYETRAPVPHRRRRRRGAARLRAVLILAAGLSVFIALYTALEERRYDLAVMRTLGASPRAAVRPAARRRPGARACSARCSGSRSATC